MGERTGINSRKLQWPAFSSLGYTLVLLIVGIVVLYPILLIIVSSFEVGLLGRDTHFGFENWANAFADAKVKSALFNTLSLAISRQAISIIVGVLIAWVLARTDLPGRRWFEFAFWIAVFMPVLTITLSWILVFDSYNGLANKLLELLPFVDKGPFDIYSYWGIQWVHILTGALPVKVMLLTPAFRNMDSSLEESARVAGSGSFGTIRRIVIPIMTPAILIAFVLGILRSLEGFEVELILGGPAKISVYSTMIYQILLEVPPSYGKASVLSVTALMMVIPMILLQQYITSRRNYATISGKFRSGTVKLGAWKWPLFTVIGLIVVLMTIMPIVMIVIGSFTKIFGMFGSGVWTLNNWTAIFQVSGFTKGLINTLIIAGGGASFSIIILFLIAYISVRTKYRARGVLDFITWMPSAIPGIIMSLGYLWLFLKTPLLSGLYGTVWVLILVVVLVNMTLGTQMMKSTMMQIGHELEEASRISGATLFYTMRRIIFPLVLPTAVVVFVTIFASAARSTSYFAVLATAKNRPLSLLQLDMMADGRLEAATVVGIILLFLAIGVALLIRNQGINKDA